MCIVSFTLWSPHVFHLHFNVSLLPFLILTILTNYMEESHSSEIHTRLFTSPCLTTLFLEVCHWTILSQLNSVHTLIPSLLRPILMLSSHLRLDLPGGLFHSGFPSDILYMFLIPPMCAICSAHRVFPDFVILIVLGEDHKIWSSSFCNFFRLLLLPLR